MPWTCPACRTPIHHSESDQRPRVGITYRCHICRLELVADLNHNGLVLAPLPSGEVDHAGGSSIRRAFVDTPPPASAPSDDYKKK
jgi:hypothetical protein